MKLDQNSFPSRLLLLFALQACLLISYRASANPRNTAQAVASEHPIFRMTHANRVAILEAPVSADDTIRKLVEREKLILTRLSIRSRPSLFKLPTKDSTTNKAPESSKNKLPEQDEQNSISEAQWKSIAQELFEFALKSSLRSKQSASLLSPVDRIAAIKKLPPEEQSLSSETSLQRFCELAKCDTALIPEVTRVSISNSGARIVSVWGKLTIINSKIETPNSFPTKTSVKKRGTTQRPSEIILFSGVSLATKLAFQPKVLEPVSHLLRDAVRKAVGAAIFQLFHSEAVPFSAMEDRLALIPVLSPSQADELAFLPGGRQVIPAALKGLPVELTSKFNPNLLPLTASSQSTPLEMSKALTELGMTVGSLWSGNDVVDISHALSLGKKLKVNYMLLAKISDIELTSDYSMTKSEFLQLPRTSGLDRKQGVIKEVETVRQEARAVAVGVLIRIRDGGILWKESATATMTSTNPIKKGENQTLPDSPDKKLANNASRFALLQLQRSFNLYRRKFERQ